MLINPSPIVEWQRLGWRHGVRVRVTGRTTRRTVRVLCLTEDGRRFNAWPRTVHSHELRLRNGDRFEDPVAELNRILASAPFIGNGDDRGPPALPGIRPENQPGSLFHHP